MGQALKKRIVLSNVQESIDSWKATCETLSDPELLKDIKEGLEDIKVDRISRVRDDLKRRCLK